MKAVILNSGAGKRLSPLTDDMPKCMIKLNSKSILELQLEILADNCIKDYIITTGPFEDIIKDFVKESFPRLNVTFVNNPLYETTNYIYSLWLARKNLDEDILLLHGDLVFEPSFIVKLLKTDNNNYIPINKKISLPKKDFKALVINDVVRKIGVDVFGDNAFFCAPLYKIKKDTMDIWLRKIEDFVNEGKTTCYAEDAFNEIPDKLYCQAFYYDEFCMEIDSINDLNIARKFFQD